MDSSLRPHAGSPDVELQSQHLPSIPPAHSRTPLSLRCCCGRGDCALLEHNQIALEGLEKDLETAARLGQVREAWLFVDCSFCLPTTTLPLDCDFEHFPPLYDWYTMTWSAPLCNKGLAEKWMIRHLTFLSFRSHGRPSYF